MLTDFQHSITSTFCEKFIPRRYE